MRQIKYFEIIALFYSGVFDQIRQGIDMNSAISIEFDSFWKYPEKENSLSNFIILIHCLNAVYSLHKTFTKKEIELFKEYYELTKNIDLTNWLDIDEIEHFNEKVYNLNSFIDDFVQNADQSK